MGLLHKAAVNSPPLPDETAEEKHIAMDMFTVDVGSAYNPDISEHSIMPAKPSLSPLEKAVMEALSSGHKKFGSFQGCVFEALKYSAGEFTGRLSSMISGFGAAQGLAPGRCLIIFSAAEDKGLITYHLDKTVPGKTIFSFQANTSQEAFSLLKPYC
ncbi:hypothetical protein AGMMS50230_04450 [Spirochaetia bacterium]|nr:hypothetical protein AGMMS50230_04450 [Spirochaetia bacterium]